MMRRMCPHHQVSQRSRFPNSMLDGISDCHADPEADRQDGVPHSGTARMVTPHDSTVFGRVRMAFWISMVAVVGHGSVGKVSA